jgi:hypothetical protein
MLLKAFDVRYICVCVCVLERVEGKRGRKKGKESKRKKREREAILQFSHEKRCLKVELEKMAKHFFVSFFHLNLH